MSKYMWRGALIGFLVSLVLGGILFAFGPESVDWSVKPVQGEVSIMQGIVIPTFVTSIIGAVTGIWLGLLLSQGRKPVVQSFIYGEILFFLAALLSIITLPFFGTAIMSLVHLPGVIITDVLIEPFLKYLRGADFLIVQSQEPLIAWTDITISWLGWGFIGGLIGRLKKR